MHDQKQVTWRGLELGQKIEGWFCDNTYHMASATVKEKNSAFVTLLVFGKQEEKVSSETATFEVKMSTEEFRRKYQTEAAQLIASIQNTLPAYAIGYHEMWNSWLTYDPYEMAAVCKENKMQIIGHCTDITPKHNLLNPQLVLDTGICVEYEDGQKFWCHGRMEDIQNMIASWKKQTGIAG